MAIRNALLTFIHQYNVFTYITTSFLNTIGINFYIDNIIQSIYLSIFNGLC